MVLLSLNVSRFRIRHRTSLSTDKHPDLYKSIRSHGNFIENIPFSLLLMIGLESYGASSVILHSVGLTTLLSRAMFSFGITRKSAVNLYRQIGITIGHLTLLTGASYLLILVTRSS
jgi:uncharacterized membrane protein YecN with MAPEG domain